jgi:hypothetical protein
MIARVVVAVVVAVVVGLVCLLLGDVLASVGVPIAVIVGGFLARWAWALGVLAGLWYFFMGYRSGRLGGVP